MSLINTNRFEIFVVQEEHDAEFPKLGSEAPKKKPRWNVAHCHTNHTCKGEKEEHDPTFTIHKDRKKVNHEEKVKAQQRREAAYKTSMCKNIEGCRYGDKCHYAHSPEELRIRECSFGERCRHIYVRDGVATNHHRAQKICQFKHPSETNAQCVERRSATIQVPQKHKDATEELVKKSGARHKVRVV